MLITHNQLRSIDLTPNHPKVVQIYSNRPLEDTKTEWVTLREVSTLQMGASAGSSGAHHK